LLFFGKKIDDLQITNAVFDKKTFSFVPKNHPELLYICFEEPLLLGDKGHLFWMEAKKGLICTKP